MDTVRRRKCIFVLGMTSTLVINLFTASRAGTGPVNPSGAMVGSLQNTLSKPAFVKPVIQAAGSGPQIGAVVNAAAYTTPVAPGSIFSLFLTGFSFTEMSATTIPLKTTLGGATVTLNGVPLPLFYVNSGQINAQLPYDVPAGASALVVSGNGATSPAFTFTVGASAPGIFICNTGTQQACVENQDFSINTPANPARAGSFVTVYMTGQGALDHAIAVGAGTPSPPPLFRALAATQANIGGLVAPIIFVGLSPGLVGLLQANIQIPPQLPPGTYPLQFLMGNVSSHTSGDPTNPVISTN